MTINDTLEAIEYIADSDKHRAANLLERISPLVFNVCEFTDGDHTRFALDDIGRISAKYNISSITSKLNQEIHEGEWSNADTTLEYFLRYTDFSSSTTRALCLTGLSNDQLKVISDRADEGDLDAQSILEELNLSDFEFSKDDNQRDSTEEGTNKLNPANFLPSDPAVLFVCRPSKDFYLEWYDFWISKGKESELVIHLYPILLKENLDDDNSRCLLDSLFISCRKIYGARKSFNVLVKAQIEMKG